MAAGLADVQAQLGPTTAGGRSAPGRCQSGFVCARPESALCHAHRATGVTHSQGVPRSHGATHWALRVWAARKQGQCPLSRSVRAQTRSLRKARPACWAVWDLPRAPQTLRHPRPAASRVPHIPDGPGLPPHPPYPGGTGPAEGLRGASGWACGASVPPGKTGTGWRQKPTSLLTRGRRDHPYDAVSKAGRLLHVYVQPIGTVLARPQSRPVASRASVRPPSRPPGAAQAELGPLSDRTVGQRGDAQPRPEAGRTRPGHVKCPVAPRPVP